ncbi:MAG: hypothetical protein AAF656_06260 [Planctomycetota bacterium]
MLATVGMWAIGFGVIVLLAWWKLDPDARVFLREDLRRPELIRGIALLSMMFALPFLVVIRQTGLPLLIDVGRRRITVRRGRTSKRVFRSRNDKFVADRGVQVVDAPGRSLAQTFAPPFRSARQIAEQINAVIGHERRNASDLTPPPVRCP